MDRQLQELLRCLETDRENPTIYRRIASCLERAGKEGCEPSFLYITFFLDAPEYREISKHNTPSVTYGPYLNIDSSPNYGSMFIFGTTEKGSYPLATYNMGDGSITLSEYLTPSPLPENPIPFHAFKISSCPPKDKAFFTPAFPK